MSTERTILVTGGAGFIGSHTCKALAQAGYHPVAYDNLSNGVQHAVRWGAFEAGDIRDHDRLSAVLTAHKPLAVMHFAGAIEAGLSTGDPLSFYDINVTGTNTLARVMHTHDVRHLVFSSTAAVYGDPQSPLIAEDHRLAPINPYGRSKVMAEQLLQDAARAHGFTFTALRFFNAAGADPDGELAEHHDPETHLIPLAIAAARNPASSLSVYGQDYPTADGTCIRDYVHVTDLAHAHIRALECLLDGKPGLTLNLGSGQGHSVNQVLDMVEQRSGQRVRRAYQGRRPGDAAVLVADISAAKTQLGWSLQHSDLSQIIDHALATLPA
ncbi:MAG: UDP-glucose 4-epimerase GalE [Pseudomonadota bacterium]